LKPHLHNSESLSDPKHSRQLNLDGLPQFLVVGTAPRFQAPPSIGIERRRSGILHLYVPTVAFAPLTDDYNLPPEPGRCIRDSWGVQDELVNQIGLSVLSEMRSLTYSKPTVDLASA
jgi:hypothetical protein